MPKARLKQPCGYSRTGWAYECTEGPFEGACTCKPCRKPKDEDAAIKQFRARDLDRFRKMSESK